VTVTDDASAEFNAAIRRAAGIIERPEESVVRVRRQLEAARATGDPAEVQRSVQEAEALADRLEGRGESPDFGAGVRQALPQAPDMNSLIRASFYGSWPRGGDR
jgi:hypothetical protein